MNTVRKFFISYRRKDSRHITDRIYDRLADGFGDANIFKDVDSIPLGANFRQRIEEYVSECDCLLAVIGEQWLDTVDESGSRRLEDANDLVRVEIETAISRGIPVIPLLVDGAEMPKSAQLPETLKELAFRNGTHVRADPDFHADMNRVIRALEEIRPLIDPGSEAPVSVSRNRESASAVIHVLDTYVKQPEWSRFASIRFSITNMSPNVLQLTQLILQVMQRQPISRIELRQPGAPVTEFKLTAEIGDNDEVDLLSDVGVQFVLNAGTSDAFSLALAADEGYLFTCCLRGRLDDLAAQTHQWLESVPFQVEYPVRSLEVLRKRKAKN